MTQIEEVKLLINRHFIAIAEETNDSEKIMFYNAKQCALITIDEKIKYHELLFDKGFKEVHIALSSPIKTYNDILNPLLKELHKLKEEIAKLQPECLWIQSCSKL